MIAMFRIDLRNWRGNPSTASATSCSNSRRRTSVLLAILQSPSPFVQASPGEQSCQRWDRPQTPSALRASKSALPVYGIASCGAGPAPARAALGHLRSGRGAPPSQARSVYWRVLLEGSWECTPKALAQLWDFSPPLRLMHPNASGQRYFYRKVACNALVSMRLS